MGTMRVLHVSDYHLGQQEAMGQQLLVEKLLDDVKILQQDRPFDLFVFTGDLSATGQANELQRAKELLLDPTMAALNIETSHVVLVPGNHDVDRDKISKYQEPGLRSLTSAEEFAGLIEDHSEFEMAIGRLSAWNSFVSSFYSGCDFGLNTDLARTHRYTFGATTIGVAALNSAWRATGAANDRDKEHLIVEESQALAALDQIDDCDCRLVAFHHPLHWLAPFNQESLRALLETRGTIVLTGHEHRPDPQSISSMRGEAVYCPTGCLYQGSSLPNCYSVIDVDVRDNQVITSLRSWMPGRQVFDKGIEHTNGGQTVHKLPRRIGDQALPIPKYTVVSAALATQANDSGSFSTLSALEPRRVEEIVVEPRFYPAPFSQIAAAVTIARSQDKSVASLMAIDVLELLDSNQVTIINGDPLSGVTYALWWALAGHYEIDAGRAPVKINFEVRSGQDPIGKLIRRAAPQFGLPSGSQDEFPPLVVAVDDVTSTSRSAVRKLCAHISANPQNIYILGCHGSNGTGIATALEEAGISFERCFTGPFGRNQLKQLTAKVGGDAALEHVDHIFNVVFGENLPRSPFVLGACVAVLSMDPQASPPNESSLIVSVIGLLLGSWDPTDVEVGLDARGREHFLQWMARKFTLDGIDRLDRQGMDQFVLDYFRERGIERSVSPLKLLSSLIERKVLLQDERGVGFRHAAFQNVMAGTLMDGDKSFAEVMLSDPIKFSEVVTHAAAINRANRELLRRVGEVAVPGIEGLVSSSPRTFDQMTGVSSEQSDDDLDRMMQASAPRSTEEVEAALDEHFDALEVQGASEIQVEIPTATAVAIQATGFLSKVLAGSELIDDVPMKAEFLKHCLQGWGAMAEELGSRPIEWETMRSFFDRIFPDFDVERREIVWQFFVRISVVFSVGMAITGILGSKGLGAALRMLSDDDEINESPIMSLYVTLLFCSLNLEGCADVIEATYKRHAKHILVRDLMRSLAMTRYLSPATADAEASTLERFLVGASTERISGVGPRSEARSRTQTKLRNERSKHRHDEVGAGLVEDLIEVEARGETAVDPESQN